MALKKETALAPAGDPFALLRQMTSEFDRAFEGWPSFRWPAFRAWPAIESAAWLPKIEVFEKDNRLVTKVDLPGMKKDDVTVEVTDGHLAISGERKRETEEQNERVYRSEREYGSFYRAVPLPEGAKLEDVKAAFADGVLEVSVPLPAKVEAKPRTIEIQEGAKGAKTAA
jgi:HSP20 family protein